MLPPVSASANAYASATEAKQRPDQPTPPRPTTANVPAAPTLIARETAVAGQLNMMLLSGPERMSQNLAALADVLGSALKIERRLDESLTDYMGRLIDGIAGLPAADRLKLQKLLTQSFAGLQLRTLLDAMANPSGPERTTLALYLELYRQTDRDGAARSVISSYRELAGELRSTEASPPRRIAANDAGRPLTDAPQPVQKAGEQLQGSRLAAPVIGRGAETGADTATSAPARLINPDAAPLSRSLASSAALGSPGEQGSSEVLRTSIASTPGPSASPPKTAEDPITAGRVPSAFAEPPVDDTDTPQAGEPFPSQRNAPAEGSAEGEPVGSQTTERATLAFATAPSVSAGARPAMTLPATWLAELLETDFVKALLHLKTVSADLGGQILGNSRPGAEKTVPPFPSPETVSRDEAVDEPEQALRVLDTTALEQAEENRLPQPALPPDQAPIRTLIAREGVPLPFISYLIDDDFKADYIEEEQEPDQDEQAGGRRQKEDRDPENSGEPADEHSDTDMVTESAIRSIDEPATPASGGSEASRTALPPPAESPLDLQVEPAHELYLRMACLT